MVTEYKNPANLKGVGDDDDDDDEDEYSDDEELDPDTIQLQNAPRKKSRINPDVVVTGTLPDLPNIETWPKDTRLVTNEEIDGFKITTIDIKNSEQEKIPPEIQWRGKHTLFLRLPQKYLDKLNKDLEPLDVLRRVTFNEIPQQGTNDDVESWDDDALNR